MDSSVKEFKILYLFLLPVPLPPRSLKLPSSFHIAILFSKVPPFFPASKARFFRQGFIIFGLKKGSNSKRLAMLQTSLPRLFVRVHWEEMGMIVKNESHVFCE